MTKKVISGRELTAYHEAGHAVAAELLKSGSVTDVVIGPAGGGKSRDNVREWRKGALVDAAGGAAERVLAGKSAGTTFLGDRADYWGSQSDNRRADAFISTLGFSSEARREERRKLDIEAESIVRWAWPAVCAVADALLERGQLTGDDVRAIMRTGKPQPRAAAPAPPAGYTSMTTAEMRSLQAVAEKRGQTRLARALARSLGDSPAELETLTVAAEFRVVEGR